ncbi:hypothetical protein [Aromatoleum sp.]|uniref:hypothetical protein n=1 Tax=Aromatoleum sp. TaxID=2307007 RepID=UPI002FCA5D27
MKRTILLSLLVLTLQPVPPVMGQPAGRAAMNPAETAFVAAASRRIEDHFVAEVARITGTTPRQVRKAMPDEHRITSTAMRLIAALEVELGTPLSAEQQAEILEADRMRKQALAQAREAAGGR